VCGDGGQPQREQDLDGREQPGQRGLGHPTALHQVGLAADGTVVADEARTLDEETDRILVREPPGGARDERRGPFRADEEEPRPQRAINHLWAPAAR